MTDRMALGFIVAIAACGLNIAITACAPTQSYPPLVQRGVDPSQWRNTSRATPSPATRPPVTPKPWRGYPLEDVVTSSAPIAARAAVCGYWDGHYWLTKVIKAAVHLDGSEEETQALAGRFSELFNQTLKAGDLSEVHCSAIQQIALDYLVMLEGLSSAR